MKESRKFRLLLMISLAAVLWLSGCGALGETEAPASGEAAASLPAESVTEAPEQTSGISAETLPSVIFGRA